MTPDPAELTQTAVASIAAGLSADLKALSRDLTSAHARGDSAEKLRRIVVKALSSTTVDPVAALEAAFVQARQYGRESKGGADGDDGVTDDVRAVIDGTAERVRKRLDRAVELSKALPMTSSDDVLAVVAVAHGAKQVVETDASWVTHRGAAIGVMDVARASGQNVVWVAERNACPHCLAYQGRVVEPGGEFPPGLTYGDKPLTPFGELIAPPLHPNCRCELDLTTLQSGSIDESLAREAARSIARGLTDYSSEAGKARAVDRLLKGATGLPSVKLPRSVLERAARNLRDGQFRFRPGSPDARVEIARRARERALRLARRRSGTAGGTNG